MLQSLLNRKRKNSKAVAAPVNTSVVAETNLHAKGGGTIPAPLSLRCRAMKSLKSVTEALQLIESGDSIFIQGGACIPHALINALTERAKELSGVKIYTSFAVDNRSLPYAKQEYLTSFNAFTFFVSSNIREAIREGVAETIPACLSEIPILFHSKQIPIDVVLLCVSLPDANGYCSYGVSSDITCAAVECAKIVIAQINSYVPHTFGDARIHISKIRGMAYYDEPLVDICEPPIGPIEQSIASYVANEVPDGATLQIGVGSIPHAIVDALDGHRHLGVHSEVISDGVMRLMQKGVVDNSNKKLYPGRTVASVAFGSKLFYRFLNNNDNLLFKDVAWVNNPYNISQNPMVMAINSAIEIDITGQVCSDSIGADIYSGIGGQHDFMYGGRLSDGGKCFIVLPSKTSKGESRIVSTLKPGAGVTTSRFQVEYIVTEFGIEYLRNKSLQQRARAMISLASPEYREQLERDAVSRFGIGFLRQAH